MPVYESIEQVVKDLCLRSGDVLQRNKGLYLNCAKDVFLDMALDSLKLAKREIFQINKKTNTVNLPKNCVQVASVSVRDRWGNFYPVWKNGRLTDDMVELSAAKDCACEYKCGNKLCNTIKGYEATVETVTEDLPGGGTQDFTLVSRKAIDDNGFLYEETQYVNRVYEDGEWTGVEVVTDFKKMCQVEVDSNGCACDTESNFEAVCNACCLTTTASDDCISFGGNAEGPPCNDPNADTWIYWCSTKLDWFSVQCGQDWCCNSFNNIYNISELGDRLIFPSNFGFDKVVVRYYFDTSLKDIQVPILAKPAFMKGLQAFSMAHNEKKMIEYKRVFEPSYTAAKFGLTQTFNKYRIAELRMITTPPVFMPSYNQGRSGYSYWQ